MTKNNLRNKGVILIIVPYHSPSRRDIREGTQGRNLIPPIPGLFVCFKTGYHCEALLLLRLYFHQWTLIVPRLSLTPSCLQSQYHRKTLTNITKFGCQHKIQLWPLLDHSSPVSIVSAKRRPHFSGSLFKTSHKQPH